MTDEQFVDVGNDVQLCYQQFGDDDAPPIVLIMGLSMQMLGFDEAFCRQLATYGYRVIRFDNRDSGKSTFFDARPSLPGVVARALTGMQVKAPYYLDDMASDVLGLIAALKLKQVLLVGVSMGGMIAQLAAFREPHKIIGLVSWMSTTGQRTLGIPRPDILWRLMRPLKPDLDSRIRRGVAFWQALGSPKYPTTRTTIAQRVAAAYERNARADGSLRQMTAIAAAINRSAILREITQPTMVLHGTSDPMINWRAGVATARRIPDASLRLLDGVGHDIPQSLFAHYAQLIDRHARLAMRIELNKACD